MGSLVAERVRWALSAMLRDGVVDVSDIVDDMLFMDPDELYDYLIEVCGERGVRAEKYGLIPQGGAASEEEGCEQRPFKCPYCGEVLDEVVESFLGRVRVDSRTGDRTGELEVEDIMYHCPNCLA